jgi:hypothetical protein
MNKITTDEGYSKALQWLVERSQKIANPLADEATKTADRGKYDAVERECLRYRNPWLFEDEKKTSLDDYL